MFLFMTFPSALFLTEIGSFYALWHRKTPHLRHPFGITESSVARGKKQSQSSGGGTQPSNALNTTSNTQSKSSSESEDMLSFSSVPLTESKVSFFVQILVLSENGWSTHLTCLLKLCALYRLTLQCASFSCLLLLSKLLLTM